MAASYRFHPEALSEYEEAADYYLREAPAPIVDEFIAAVESAITRLTAAPTRRRIAEEPEIRRCVLNRFPFLIF